MDLENTAQGIGMTARQVLRRCSFGHATGSRFLGTSSHNRDLGCRTREHEAEGLGRKWVPSPGNDSSL